MRPKVFVGGFDKIVHAIGSRREVPSVVSRCPECAQAQRHPDTAGRISCPCGVVYAWPSGLALLEVIAVPFVCAKTDRPFTIVQERINRCRPFRHRGIEASGDSRLRRRLAGEKGDAFTVEVSEQKVVSAENFDTSGCVCPHCEPGPNSSRYSYICCSSCGAYVCSGSVAPRRDGRLEFTCRASCGGRGEIVNASDPIAVTKVNVERRQPLTHTYLARRGHSLQVRP